MGAGSSLSLTGTAATATIDQLVHDGGHVNYDWGPLIDQDLTGFLAGTIAVESASSIFSENGRHQANEGNIRFIINASISGTAPLYVGRVKKWRRIILTGDNRNFSGGWIVEGGLNARSPTVLGSEGGIQAYSGTLLVSGGILGPVEMWGVFVVFEVNGPTTVAL